MLHLHSVGGMRRAAIEFGEIEPEKQELQINMLLHGQLRYKLFTEGRIPARNINQFLFHLTKKLTCLLA